MVEVILRERELVELQGVLDLGLILSRQRDQDLVPSLRFLGQVDLEAE